eukprot:scaffold127798_cov21-Tisochrysis_lutea.AAC.3
MRGGSWQQAHVCVLGGGSLEDNLSNPCAGWLAGRQQRNRYACEACFAFGAKGGKGQVSSRQGERNKQRNTHGREEQLQ